MNVSRDQFASRPQEIGTFKGQPVMEVALKGGLHLVFAVKKNGGTETLGTGSHRAVARFVAEKENPDLAITELTKSEDLPKWLVEKLAADEGAVEQTRAFRATERELAKE
jgi:hypothetical protein